MPVESESRRQEDWYEEARAGAEPGDVNRPLEITRGVSISLDIGADLEEGSYFDSDGRIEIVAEDGIGVADEPHIWIEYVSSDGESSATIFVDRQQLSTLIAHLQTAQASIDAALDDGTNN